MKNSSQSRIAKILCVLALSVLIFNSSCKKEKEEPVASIQVKTSSTLGTFLIDAQGKTLYVFSPDVKGNASVCTGGCLTAWPAFYSADLSVAQGLNAADFSNFTRSDGSKQTAFKGWPLYYYAQDVQTGDTKGDKVGGVWFLAKDYSLMVARQGKNLYLSDINGRTLYLFTKDSPNTSVCTGGCLTAWPAFSAENPVVPSSMSAADFTTITRSDQAKQLTYKGAPLYYYTPDATRGDTLGQGVGKVWYTVAP